MRSRRLQNLAAVTDARVTNLDGRVTALEGAESDLDYTSVQSFMQANSVSVFTSSSDDIYEEIQRLASGFFTRDVGGDNELLICTCAHCVIIQGTTTPLPFIMIAFYTGTTPTTLVWAGVDVIAIDAAHDLALLKIREEWLVPSQVDGIQGLTFYVPTYEDDLSFPPSPSMSFKTGTPLVMCGYTGGQDQFSFTRGYVCEAMGTLGIGQTFEPGSDAWRTPSFVCALNAAPGNSGSCVVLPLEDFKVAGLLFAGRSSIVGEEMSVVTHPMTTKITLDRMYEGWIGGGSTLMYENIPRFFNLQYDSFPCTPLTLTVSQWYKEPLLARGFNQNATTVSYTVDPDYPSPDQDPSLGRLQKVEGGNAYVASGNDFDYQNVVRMSVTRGDKTVSYAMGLQAPFLNLIFMQWLFFPGETPTISSDEFFDFEAREKWRSGIATEESIVPFAMPLQFRLAGGNNNTPEDLVSVTAKGKALQDRKGQALQKLALVKSQMLEKA